MIDTTGLLAILKEIVPDIQESSERKPDELHPYRYCQTFSRLGSSRTVRIHLDCKTIDAGFLLKGYIAYENRNVTFRQMEIQTVQHGKPDTLQIDLWVREFCDFLNENSSQIANELMR